MKLLTELLSDFRRLGPTDDLPSNGNDDGEFDLDSDEDIDDALPDPNGEEDGDGGFDDLSLDDDDELDGVANEVSEDPNRAGLIRTVPNAHLVYKRKAEDGTFEELWIYNISSLNDELDVRKAILAGTDIPVSKTRSPDGSQTYSLWSAGNAEMLKIIGLPN